MSEYQNPVIRGVNPDPTAVRVGEDYYLATSSLLLFPAVPIYHSRDLVHWQLISHAITRPEQCLADRTGGVVQIYAPTLRYHDGIFYLITTNVALHGGNFYVTAKDPAGPWSDAVFVDDGVFDPSLFFDDDGKVYYTRRGGFGVTDTVQAEIDIATGRLKHPLRPVNRGFVSEDCEGAHLYKINGWYYMMQAEGGSRYLHMETIGRSRSPWGPFEGSPYNPVLGQLRNWGYPVCCAGHAELIEAHDGSWWMFFLATRHGDYDSLCTIGRETFLLPVTWKDGWPTTDTSQLADLRVTASLPPSRPFDPMPPRDDFSATVLDEKRFVYVHISGRTSVDLTTRPSWLRLRPLGDQLSECQPSAFVATRQTEVDFAAETNMEFSPQEQGDEAGLSIFQKANFHYDLYVTLNGDQRVLMLRKRVMDMLQEVEVATLPPTGAIRLRIRGELKQYHFEYALANQEFQSAGNGWVNLLSTEIAQSWFGALIGMFAASRDPSRGPAADFDYFEFATT